MAPELAWPALCRNWLAAAAAWLLSSSRACDDSVSGAASMLDDFPSSISCSLADAVRSLELVADMASSELSSSWKPSARSYRHVTRATGHAASTHRHARAARPRWMMALGHVDEARAWVGYLASDSDRIDVDASYACREAVCAARPHTSLDDCRSQRCECASRSDSHAFRDTGRGGRHKYNWHALARKRA